MAMVSTTSMVWSTELGPAPLQYPWSNGHVSQHRPQSDSTHRLLHHHANLPATPSFHTDTRLPFERAASATVIAPPHCVPRYDGYPGSRDALDATHRSVHSLETAFYTSQLPARKRTRQKVYSSEEARQAAKAVQKAKRREQNRNAQRRLRDRKEEHILNLESEVAQLKKQGEQHRCEMQGLEDLIRRLLEQRQQLEHKLETFGIVSPTSTNDTSESERVSKASARLAPRMSPLIQQLAQLSNKIGRAPEDGNALGLSEYESPSSSSAASYLGTRSNSNAYDVPGRETTTTTTSVSSASSNTNNTPRMPSVLSPTVPSAKAMRRHGSIPNSRPPLLPSTNTSSEQQHLLQNKLNPQCEPLLTVPSQPPVTAHWSALHS